MINHAYIQSYIELIKEKVNRLLYLDWLYRSEWAVKLFAPSARIICVRGHLSLFSIYLFLSLAKNTT